MYALTSIAAAIASSFKLQRKSAFENEIDGCHKGLKNDMCATYSAYLELHSMCSFFYDMYYYLVHKSAELYIIAHLLKTAYCGQPHTSMVLYVKLVISLDEKAGLTYLTV